ncbi:hypothetical protein BBJ28_00017320 [Nothophytophthora sp. Chile5]|nr:hypothetical protein BBJ28_00017320 [Nothophytophthora sp. Chile5]
MFRRFLSECTNALMRSLLREWYSVAIVRKKASPRNSKKYIEYFSAWFGSSPKALVPKLFAAWKRDVAEKRTRKIQKQLEIDVQGLNAVKRQVDELTRQRDVAQVESLAVRNDRKQAESWAQQLEQRIKAASDELSGRTFSKFFHYVRERIEARGEMALFAPAQAQETPSVASHQPRQHENETLARDYKQLLHAIRVQDEHYASHSKLFSSRMLESHEVSLVPNPNRAVSDLDGRPGADSGDLGVINGVKRFWTPRNVASGKPKTPLKSGKSTRFTSHALASVGQQNQTQLASLGTLALLQEGDFDISPRHSRGFTELFLAHLATEYGALLFSPADLSAFTHNVYLHPGGKNEKTSGEGQVAVLEDANKLDATATRKHSSRIQPPTQTATTDTPPPDTTRRLSEMNADLAAVSGDPLRNIQPLVTAYSAWNQISDQLIAAGVVQSRGLVPKAAVEATGDSSGEDQSKVQSTSAVPVPGTPIRPILQHQFEPLGHSSFIAPPRDKGGHGRRMSITSGDASYHTARIRHLSAEAPARLIESMETLHASVKATTSKLRDFHITCRQVRELQLVQWEQASELASQFVSAREAAPQTASSNLGDQRQHVFECISFSNSTMRRLLSVEDNPESELVNVRAVFETHQRLLRRLYTPHRGSIKHAVSLDDLWHIVKILRLPREVHVLPILRDEELVANGYEQLFSPEDLAELFLQLCNEQFHPQVTPLSARVEYFILHHLPLAVQNQSLIRALMHHSEVKLAISGHSQTIRIIFRRYCAKERELMMPASGVTKQRQRHTGHGITKYMRMIDWLAFIQDYHLLRARFSMEQATSLFRNVQEVTAGRDENLELIYSEFCEALVGVAMWYFPDPFLKAATKVTQFLRRYLPLSPDEAHDYA